jgi:hypothetical protein
VKKAATKLARVARAKKPAVSAKKVTAKKSAPARASKPAGRAKAAKKR